MTYSFFFSRFWWSLSRQFVPLPSFHLQVTVESFSLVRGRRKVEEAGFRRLKLRLPAPADLSRFPFHWHNSQMWSVSSTSTLEHSFCSPLPAGRLWALSFLPFLFSIAPAHSAFRTAHTRSPTGTFICHLRHFAVPSIVTVLYMSVSICLLLSACLNCFCEYECELSCLVVVAKFITAGSVSNFTSFLFACPNISGACRLSIVKLSAVCALQDRKEKKGKRERGKTNVVVLLTMFPSFPIFSLSFSFFFLYQETE